MRTVILDAAMGASGDMFLGTCLDLGADPDRLAPIESAIDANYEVERVDRSGIEAVSVDVEVTESTHHRTRAEVLDIIGSIEMDPTSKAVASAIVDRLATAEAAIHGESEDTVTFHEVGADDAIADICGTAVLLDDLDIERLFVGPVAAGSGTVETAHGVYPIPAPAVGELAAGASWSLQPGPIDSELLTPTGAAILAELADGGEPPAIRVESSGFGAGDRQFDRRPNVLRGLLGETTPALRRDDVALLETIVDDATPETLGALHDTLRSAGALDVAILPTTMKKSRPGHLIRVVTPPETSGLLARRLAVETGSLGVREVPVTHRWVADRRIEPTILEIDGVQFEIDVKIASDDDGAVIDISAEHDDAVAIAAETGIATREIVRRAEDIARQSTNTEDCIDR